MDPPARPFPGTHRTVNGREIEAFTRGRAGAEEVPAT